MSVIDNYLETLQPGQHAQLKRVRDIVRRTVPNIEETISYGMPALKYKSKPLIYFSAFKNHMSIFPTAAPAEALKEKLSAFRVSKGTIQFTEENPLPENLIVELVRLRVQAIDAKS